MVLSLLPTAALGADEAVYQDISGYSTPSGLTVQTKSDYPWTISAESGYLTSGNTSVIGSATLSNLKVTAAEAGYLKFEYASPKADLSDDIFAWGKIDFSKRSEVTYVPDGHSGELPFQEGIIQVDKEDGVYFTFSRTRNSTGEGYAQIRNLRLATGGAITVSSSNDALGSAASNPAETEKLNAGTQVTLTATEKGGQFAGWYETVKGGAAKLVSMDNPYTYTVTEDASLQARFITVAKDAVATVNGKDYDDLQTSLTDAAKDATATSPVTVILQKDVTVEDELTVPQNVILLVPYDADDTGAEPEMSNPDSVRKREAPYRTLTIAASASLKIKGTLLVNARLSSSDTNHQGSLGGYFGVLELNGKATVTSTGALKVRGMVVGTGDITANRGGQIWQAFEMTDWPGGSKAAELNNNKEFPINQYYLQRIQVRTVIEEGASMSAYAYLFVPSNNASIQLPMQGLIGPAESAFFQIESGNVIMEYDPESYTSRVSIDGKVDLNSFSLTMGSYSVGTDEIVCPIPGSFAIALEDGAEVNITSDMKLLPGASLTVANGATLNVLDGADIYLYGTADYPAARTIPSSSNAEKAITPESGAQVANNGTINNSGSIHTSAADKTQQITGSGKITGKTVLDDYGAENLTYTVTWKNGDTVLETDANVARGAKPEYNGETPTKAEDDDNTYEFSGWQDANGAALTDETTVTDDVTYRAQFTATEKPPVITVDLGSGAYPWVNGAETQVGHDVGTDKRTEYYYSSNYHVKSSSSAMTITVAPRADGYLSFDYISSGEGKYDVLTIAVNGNPKKYNSVQTDAASLSWTNYKLYCFASEQTVVTLTYSKDSHDDYNSDRAFVSAVEYVEAVTRSPLTVTFDSGTVAGSTLGTVSSGEQYQIRYGTSETLTATPNDGYKFSGWYEGETLKSTERTYTVTGAEGSSFALEARFEVAEAKTLTVTFADDITVTAGINGGDSAALTSGTEIQVYDGSDVTLTAVPKDGVYAYVQLGFKNSEGEFVSSAGEYSFKMAENVAYSAEDMWVTIDGLAVPDGLTIKTASAYPWTVADGVLTSGNKGVKSSVSQIAIVPKQSGLLSFDLKVSAPTYKSTGLFGTPHPANAYLAYRTSSPITTSSYTGGNTYQKNQDWTDAEMVTDAGKTVYIGYVKLGNTDESGYDDLAWLRNISFVPGTQKNITVTKDSDEQNSTIEVTGVTDGLAQFNASVTLTAKPDADALFDGWYEIKGEGENKTETKVTADKTYTFNATKDRSFVARFHKKAVYTITPSFNGNGTVSYTVNGSEARTATNGTAIEVKEADKIVLTATKNDNAIFDGWFKGETKSASTAYTINSASENLTLEARFHAKADYTLTATFPNGTATYTVNSGEAQSLNSGMAATVKETDKVVVTVAPSEGYQFLGWINGDEPVKTSTTYTINSTTGNINLTANIMCIPDGDPVAKIKDTDAVFTDLKSALENASNGHVVVLLKDYALTENVTVPAGVTLLVPFNDANTVITNRNISSNYEAYQKATASTEYRRLTVQSGVSLTVEGNVSVASKVYCMSTGQSGPYGLLQLEEDSHVTFKSGSNLYAFGYVRGSGAVNVESGANVYESLFVADYPGSASNLNTLKKANVFPFSKFTIRNVEASMTLYAGANEEVYFNLYGTTVGYHDAWIKLIGGSSALFETDSSVTKSYKNNRQNLVTHGNAKINSMSLSMQVPFTSVNISTSSLSGIVIPFNYTITVADGTTTLNDNVILSKGSAVMVAHGAKVVVPTGKNLYVLDGDDDGQAVGTQPDAKLDINGTVEVFGGLMTSPKGANITSSGNTGNIVFNSNAAASKEIAVKTGNTTTAKITMTPAQLLNADETYTQTAEAREGTAFYYANGTWVTEFTLGYDANAGGDAVTVPTGGTYSFDGTGSFTVAAAPTREGYTFTGWNTAAGGTGTVYTAGQTVTVTQSLGASMTLYAQWEEITGYAVTVENKTGTTPAATVSLNDGAAYNAGDTFTVSCANACVVAWTTDDKNYTRMNPVNDGDTHTFTLPNEISESGFKIIVALKGDVNGDGAITAMDYGPVFNHFIGSSTLEGFAFVMADINGDGSITAMDYGPIFNQFIGSADLTW